jgi:hypothetical protein
MKAKVLSIALDALVDTLLTGVQLAMALEMAAGCEPLPAGHAEVRLHPCVAHHVRRQMGLLHKALGAERAHVRLLVTMQHPVLLQRVFGSEGARTLVAGVLRPRGI